MKTSQDAQDYEKAILDWKNNLVTLLRNVATSQIKITDIRKMKTSDNRSHVIIEGVVVLERHQNMSFCLTKDVSK